MNKKCLWYGVFHCEPETPVGFMFERQVSQFLTQINIELQLKEKKDIW